jgi:hypothetical protein
MIVFELRDRSLLARYVVPRLTHGAVPRRSSKVLHHAKDSTLGCWEKAAWLGHIVTALTKWLLQD